MDNVYINIKLRSTDNKTETVKVNNVNPNASTGTLKTFAQKLNNLTSNTLVSVSKTVSSDITEEPEPQGVTFNLNLDLFAQNPDFIKQGIDWVFAELNGVGSDTVWVDETSVNEGTVNFKGHAIYEGTVQSTTQSLSASQNVFKMTVNGTAIQYNIGQWINFDSETLIADLNQKLSDTAISYSNGKLTFTNDSALNITLDGALIITKRLQNYIGNKFNGQTLPNGVTITSSMGLYTVTVNLTETGVTTLGSAVTDISPSYTILDGEYSEDVQAKINAMVPTMNLFSQVYGGDDSVNIPNIDSDIIEGLAYFGTEESIGETGTWIVYPVQFGNGNGEVKFNAGDFGISTENWGNYSWAFIAKFDNNEPTCYSNIYPDVTAPMERLITDNVGNTTALIYLIPKAG